MINTPSHHRPIRLANSHEHLARVLAHEVLETNNDSFTPAGPDWQQRAIIGLFERWALREAHFYGVEKGNAKGHVKEMGAAIAKIRSLIATQ